MSAHPVSLSYPAAVHVPVAAPAARPALQPTILADRCWRAWVQVAAPLGRTCLR